jgi:CBS domain-containing protein
MTTARELMTENPATIRLDAKVRDAVQVLQTLDVRHLPIVRADGTLVGILSDRDLRALSLPYIVLDEYVGNLQTALDASVATLMNTDVLSVQPEADASEIVDLMLENKIGAVPVAEADGTLVGIVSYVDVLRELPLDDEN